MIWIWRRRRNQSHGYWEGDFGERVGPIPLTANGRAAFVPRERLEGAAAALQEIADLEGTRGGPGKIAADALREMGIDPNAGDY